jgi:protein SCO1
VGIISHHLITEEQGKADMVTPIMITVDPYRDSVEQINSYVKEFHPRLVGLTGTPVEIKQVAKDFRIYNFVPEKAGQEDYLVDHSVFTFLMGPKGGFLDFFGPDKDEAAILDRVLERMRDLDEEANPPTLWTQFTRKWDSLRKKISF